MKPRYYPRAVVLGSAVFTGDGIIGEGQVLDLTLPGCLIDSPCSPRQGDSLELCLDIPQVGALFNIARGVVRWVQGARFGVEFIEMDPRERFQYNAFVGTLLDEQVGNQAARNSRHAPQQQNRALSAGSESVPPPNDLTLLWNDTLEDSSYVSYFR